MALYWKFSLAFSYNTEHASLTTLSTPDADWLLSTPSNNNSVILQKNIGFVQVLREKTSRAESLSLHDALRYYA